MNRRGFIGMLIGGIAAAAAVRTWPFRIYSFPAEVKAPSPLLQCVALQLEKVREQLPRLYENDQILISRFEQEGGLGLGSGTTWKKGPDGLPRIVRPRNRAIAIVTDIDYRRKTITLESL